MMKGDALLSLHRYHDAEAVYRSVEFDQNIREGLRALAKDKAARAAFYKVTSADGSR
jgi:hypothetical protein